MQLVKMYFIGWLLLCFVGLSSCSRRAVPASSTPATISDNRPGWIQQRPISSIYYIGIGSASVRQPEYQEAAKKNALQDLISEIRVSVSATSFLYQLDRGGSFREEYESNIKTTVTAEIENFEMVDTYQDGERYWVYYRLSRVEYQRQQEVKKENARRTSLAFYRQAQLAEQQGLWLKALEGYFQSLFAIQTYWGEHVGFEENDDSRSLMVEAYGGIQRILSRTSLQLLPSELRLRRRAPAPATLQLKAATPQGSSFALLPIRCLLEGGNGVLSCPPQTNHLGEAQIEVRNALSAAGSVYLVVEPDLMALSKAKADDGLQRLLLEQFTLPRAFATVYVQSPVVYIESAEYNLGQLLQQKRVEDIVKQELSKDGVSFTTDASRADVWLRIEAQTEADSRSGNIHISRLHIRAVALDVQSQTEILSTSLSNIRGFQTDFERAGLDAYQKADQEVRLQLVRRLRQALL